jgi:hypothetical protein
MNAHSDEYTYYDDNGYCIHECDGSERTVINKKSHSQTPFTESLKILRDNIEALSTFHQIEVLRILYKNHITFSENKNGVFLNLSYVNLDVIHKISEYVTFVQNQESQMCEFEKKKMTLSNQYFK